jgi:hypothetical protein
VACKKDWDVQTDVGNFIVASATNNVGLNLSSTMQATEFG